MSKRLSYEYVKSVIEKEGYKLLSNSYINMGTKLKLLCPEGHKWYVTFGNFNYGTRCSYCLRQSQRVPYDTIKDYINSQGYQLISNSYINNATKLKLLCPSGHIYNVRWSDFRHGVRCSHCAGCARKTYSEVKEYIKSQGYRLISKKYKNNHTKLEVQCPKGHEYGVKFNVFQQGRRCPVCAKSGSNHPSWKGGVRNKNIPLYDTYADRLHPVEETRKTREGYLEVRCSNCQKWLVPTIDMVCNRIKAINSHGGHRFYCSDKCKQACPVYGQVKYPKGMNPNQSRPHQTEWANIVKARDNHTCQICGSKNNLTAHHIEPVICDPVQSLDIDNGITLCSNCHKRVHSEDGCRYSDLRKIGVEMNGKTE